MSDLFGWDLLFSSVRNDIKSKADVLACFTHYVLISKNFSCIGSGDDKVLDGNETKSEKLPPEWNQGYQLRYVYQGKMYHLKGTVMDDVLQLNLIKVLERNISLICIKLINVQKLEGPVEEVLPDYVEIKKTIESDLIEATIQSSNTTSTTTQTDPQTFVPVPVTYPPLPCYSDRPHGMGGALPLGAEDLHPFPGVNPFRRIDPLAEGPMGSGGMLMPGPGDPLMRGVPRRGIPPGARFDPFFPPDHDLDGNQPRGRRPPNRGGFGNDFAPPGFNNDMFM